MANVYYWKSMAGLQDLIKQPKYLEEKAAQPKWLNGYQVIISKIIRAYGDGAFVHSVSIRNNGE